MFKTEYTFTLKEDGCLFTSYSIFKKERKTLRGNRTDGSSSFMICLTLERGSCHFMASVFDGGGSGRGPFRPNYAAGKETEVLLNMRRLFISQCGWTWKPLPD